MHVDLQVTPQEVSDGGIFKQKSHTIYLLNVNIQFTDEEKTAIELLGYENTTMFKGLFREVGQFGDNKGKELFKEYSWAADTIFRNNGRATLSYLLELR